MRSAEVVVVVVAVVNSKSIAALVYRTAPASYM